MYFYKDFIYQITKLSMKEPYIILVENIVPSVTSYVRELDILKHDEDAHHKYYGEVKKLVISFFIYFSWTIDDVAKEADKCTHVMDKEELLRLLEASISTHTENQIAFGKQFLPVKTREEKEIYEEMEEIFKKFMVKANDLRDYIQRFEKQERVDEFAKEHFEFTVKMTSELFHYTHFYISMMLVDRANHIRVSVEEIHLRMKNNLNKLKEEFEELQKEMVIKLYNKNKENLTITRRERRSTVQFAEVSRCIQTLRNKIESFEAENVLDRLEKEVEYWASRVTQFHEVYNNLKKVTAELEKLEKEEQIYNSLKNTDIPGSKRQCWTDMGKNFADRREYLMQLKVTQCKTLFTFFAARGYDRIYYTDNVGTYYMDEFKHQIYATEHGLGIYHVNCEGEFVDPPEKPYYFDKNGRYVIENGRKIYQAALCTSEYDLGPDNVFHKITKDCGHSERHNPECKLEVTDPNKFEILPDVTQVNFKHSVNSEMIKYIWDKFGNILPDALYDVCMKQPHNPIHFLAHRLLHHKYNQTAEELAKKHKHAQAYRANVYKERKDKDIEASKAWKAKQWKKAKPEDTDDPQARAAYDAQQAQQDFIDFLNIYNQ